MRTFGFALAVSAALGVVACDKSTTDASPPGSANERSVCDPLVVAPEPLTLRTVLAAGRAPDGTVYLLDHGGPRPDVVSDERLFRSNGAVLQRLVLRGSGSSPDFYTAMFPEGQIRIELANGVATRMGVTSSLEQDPKTKSFDISSATELTIVGADVYGSMRLANISVQTITYDAKTSDGHRFVAFQPTVDYADDKVRVFYGTDDHLLQRKVTEKGSARSGNSTITFDLDGVAMTANIYYNGPFGPPGQSNLANASGTVSATLTPVEGSPGYGATGPIDYSKPDAAVPPPPVQKPAAELTAGLTFMCF